jgi:hypothetical protein
VTVTDIRAVDSVEGICFGEANPYADAQALRGLGGRPDAQNGPSGVGVPGVLAVFSGNYQRPLTLLRKNPKLSRLSQRKRTAGFGAPPPSIIRSKLWMRRRATSVKPAP